jgi:precorrin-2 dehydrogenase / sirohydrochlorin ferrochelatase
MIPIVLDPTRTSLALIGRAAPARRRLELLLAGGADAIAVFSDAPSADLAELAAHRLRRRLPEASELAGFRVVWIVDLPLAQARPLVAVARAAGALVNLEDVKDSCDFHNPSIVRRGDLLLTVSTGGRSPGLAARIRRQLERSFGPEWALRLEQVSARRAAWRRRTRPLAELARLTDAMIDRQCWLPRPATRDASPRGASPPGVPR